MHLSLPNRTMHQLTSGIILEYHLQENITYLAKIRIRRNRCIYKPGISEVAVNVYIL